MKSIQSLCVFCGSRAGADPVFSEAAGQLGLHSKPGDVEPLLATLEERATKQLAASSQRL